MPSATFGLFVNSSTVEAKNLTVGVESYESTVTSGVFALVGDLSAETLTINVKAAEEVDPDVESTTLKVLTAFMPRILRSRLAT